MKHNNHKHTACYPMFIQAAPAQIIQMAPINSSNLQQKLLFMEVVYACQA
jgi:hypothetical protein